MTLLRALAFHPRQPLPEPEAKPMQTAAPAPQQQTAPPVASAPPPQNLPQSTSRCWRRAVGCSEPREQPPQKVNRQPHPRAAGE